MVIASDAVVLRLAAKPNRGERIGSTPHTLTQLGSASLSACQAHRHSEAGILLRTGGLKHVVGMSDLVRAGSLGKGGLGGVGRQTRVERPRPLKMSGGREPELRHEDLLVLLEAVLRALVSRQYDGQMVGQVAGLCANLKRSGATLETSHKVKPNRSTLDPLFRQVLHTLQLWVPLASLAFHVCKGVDGQAALCHGGRLQR